ncbi:MAG: tRNA uridine-5-carboxymethylaminomethyl(34) synthesis GTPase MnmE [Polynucleobacter sp.]
MLAMGPASRKIPIVAIATAPGKAGVGVVRISGEGLQELAIAITNKRLQPRKATLVDLRNQDGRIIDSCLAIYFLGPHSFTGEDVLELQCHGGPQLLDLVVRRCLQLGYSAGLAIAEPGEFSLRAFLNGKIDLAQAEAIADLIDAQSHAAVMGAARSLQGAFSDDIHRLVQALTQLRILVESTLDFPEEEIEFLENAHARQQLTEIQEHLQRLLATAKQGQILRDGVQLVLVGAPNVGKSSLLNCLAGEEIAIVTAVPGTTRDRVKQSITLDGVPLHIIDTAGLRQTDDEVEAMGIERTWASIRTADLLLFIEAPGADSAEEPLSAEVTAALPVGCTVLRLVNKADLLSAAEKATGSEPLYISAKTGAGIPELKNAILSRIGWRAGQEDVLISRQRHIDCLMHAEAALNKAGLYALQGNRALELFAEELRLAQEQLGQITGRLLPDDLLGKIFSQFCIGK